MTYDQFKVGNRNLNRYETHKYIEKGKQAGIDVFNIIKTIRVNRNGELINLNRLENV